MFHVSFPASNLTSRMIKNVQSYTSNRINCGFGRSCLSALLYLHTSNSIAGDEWFCVPCSSRVNEPTCTLCPRKDGAFVRIRGAHYCHAFCAERTPGARLVDPVIVTEVHESTAAGGGAGTGLVLRKEEAFSDWGEVESSMTGGKASKTKASKAKVMFEELESGSLGAGEEGEDASAGGRGAGGLGGKISATKTLGGKMSRVGNGSGAGGKTAAAYAKTAETKSIPKVRLRSRYGVTFSFQIIIFNYGFSFCGFIELPCDAHAVMPMP